MSQKWLTAAPTNHTPTLNNITDPGALNLNAGQQTVAISGISDGDSEAQTIQITVSQRQHDVDPERDGHPDPDRPAPSRIRPPRINMERPT